jgi:hypothetical protein
MAEISDSKVMKGKKVNQVSDLSISEMAPSTAQANDLIPVARAGLNYAIPVSSIPGGSGFAMNIPTVGSSIIPSPLFSPSETPSGMNPAIYVQDVNGDWHVAGGIDTTTPTSVGVGAAGPLPPSGALAWTRRTYFRDTLSPQQTAKNAFVSMNHAACANTANTNQDRVLALSMSNLSATIASFSITSNVVTLNVNSMLGVFNTPVFQVGMVVKATGLSTGTYLNNVALTIDSVTLTSAGHYALTLSSSSFTHADVTLTTDAGKLDQYLYSMACNQSELDIYGAPQFVTAVDSELSCMSFQVSDQHVGNINAPNIGANCIRAQYFRSTGAGAWGSLDGAVARFIYSNNSTVDAGGAAAFGIKVTVTSGVTPVNFGMYGIWIDSPGATHPFSNNHGLYIADFGAVSRADFAIQVAGGNTSLAGLCTAIKTVSSNYQPTISDSTILCNGTLTVTLPTIAQDNLLAGATGQTFTIKNIGTGTVTVAAHSGNLDGTSSTTLPTQYQSIKVQWDGSSWWIV